MKGETKTTKCHACGKEIVLETVIPPSWFGLFCWDGMLLRAICSDCIRKPENKDWAKGAAIPDRPE